MDETKPSEILSGDPASPAGLSGASPLAPKVATAHAAPIPVAEDRMVEMHMLMLAALRRAALALAFAAESWPAMQDDYEAVSAAIRKATDGGVNGNV